MDFSFLSQYYKFFIQGTSITLIVSFFTVLFGIVLGITLSLMKLSNNKIFRSIASVYISFVRGTPVLVQLYIIYYGLPTLGIQLPEITFMETSVSDMIYGIIALSLNSGAYVSEIIRAGIEAIDKGQMEASRSLGMSYGMAMKHIIIPQAFKNILPALGNEFIVVIKESSIISVIGIHDLMFNSNIVRGATFRPFEPLIVAAIVYFILTFTLSKLLGIIEGRLKVSDRS